MENNEEKVDINLDEEIKKQNQLQSGYYYSRDYNYSKNSEPLIKSIGIVLIFMVVVLIVAVIMLVLAQYRLIGTYTNTMEQSRIEYVEEVPGEKEVAEPTEEVENTNEVTNELTNEVENETTNTTNTVTNSVN